MSKIAKVEIGDKFERLTIVEDLGRIVKSGTKTKMHYVKCKCDCNKSDIIVPLTHLNTGKIKSCGCLKRELMSKKTKKYNNYYTFSDIVFVKFSNCNEYFICDLDDWNNLKECCWRKDNHGYAITDIKGKTFRFHRIITSCPDNLEVDHIKRVYVYICDNRKKNLNVVTHQENMENKDVTSKNKSGVCGVYYDKTRNKWVYQIKKNGKVVSSGRFDSKEDAVKERAKAERKFFEYKTMIGEAL